MHRIHALCIALSLTFLACPTLAVPSSTAHYDSPAPPSIHSHEEYVQEPQRWHTTLLSWVKALLFTSSCPDPPLLPDPALPALSAEPLSNGFFTLYEDQLVVRFNISSEKEAQRLRDACSILFLDVWEASEDWVDIRLAHDVLPSLLGLLPPALKHAHKPFLSGERLARAVADTYPARSYSDTPHLTSFQTRKAFTPTLGTSQANEFFREFRTLPVLVSWMRLLQSLFPQNVRLVTVGRSWEGRDIHGIRVGVHPTNAQDPLPSRKTVIITGGAHAREWISVSTVSYVMYKLVTGYGRDSDITTLLERLDFLFIPTINPDGYAYSWDVDRLWRKTRQPSPIRFCRGIDLDRTWGFEWTHNRLESSANPCSESYAGEEPFASVEAKSLADWVRTEIKSHNVSVVGMLDLHSYSQSILYPYSFSCYEEPPALEDLQEMGQGLAKAIRQTTQEDYKVTSACKSNVLTRDGHEDSITMPRIESAGGSPLDWFYHEMRVKHSYQIKLRDNGMYGFLLPPEYIIPSGEEILNAVVYLGKALADLKTYSDTAKKPSSSYDDAQKII